MKVGDNPAKNLMEDLFILNTCGVDDQDTCGETNDQLEAQGVKDVFRFLDREVVDKIVDLIKQIDIEQLKKLILLVGSMVETRENGDIFLNLGIKLKDGENEN